MRKVPKKDLSLEVLLKTILDARRSILSSHAISVTRFYERKKKGNIGVCPGCGEAYPTSQGSQCRACQGDGYVWVATKKSSLRGAYSLIPRPILPVLSRWRDSNTPKDWNSMFRSLALMIWMAYSILSKRGFWPPPHTNGIKNDRNNTCRREKHENWDGEGLPKNWE